MIKVKLDILTKRIDLKALEELFNEYYIPLCRFCAQFVRNTNIAEDIVQDTFVKIWEKRDSIIVNTSYKSYLYTSVRNKAIDHLKSRSAKLMNENVQLDDKIADAADITESIEKKETEAIINKAIESLPEKCFVIFSLKRYGELSNEQIAEKLNLSEKTVQNQITIAKKKLKAYFQKYNLL